MLPPETSLEISVAETSALLGAEDQPIRLIDCREEDEHAYCKIDGAELMPLSRFAEEVSNRLLLAAEDAPPIVVYCHHGMRSMSATQFLRQKGIKRAWSMSGGIETWSTEIDPEVKRY